MFSHRLASKDVATMAHHSFLHLTLFLCYSHHHCHPCAHVFDAGLPTCLRVRDDDLRIVID